MCKARENVGAIVPAENVGSLWLPQWKVVPVQLSKSGGGFR